MSISTNCLSDSLLNHGQSREVTPTPFQPTSNHGPTDFTHAIVEDFPTTLRMTDEILEEVIQEYVDKLSDDDKVAFLSAPDIIEHLHEIQSNGKSLITSSLTTRVEKVIQCVKSFTGSLTILHSEISALVVGGAHCILMVGLSNIYLLFM